MTGSQNGDYGFFSALGNHRELELAFLDVENHGSDVALREDNLILLIFGNRLSIADLGEKLLGIKRDLAFLRHEDPRLARQWVGQRSGTVNRSILSEDLPSTLSSWSGSPG